MEQIREAVRNGNTYSDPEFLAALRDCNSAPVRAAVIRLDSMACFLRFDAIDPREAADELNRVGMMLLELATAKQRRAAA